MYEHLKVSTLLVFNYSWRFPVDSLGLIFLSSFLWYFLKINLSLFFHLSFSSPLLTPALSSPYAWRKLSKQFSFSCVECGVGRKFAALWNSKESCKEVRLQADKHMVLTSLLQLCLQRESLLGSWRRWWFKWVSNAHDLACCKTHMFYGGFGLTEATYHQEAL